MALEHEKYLEVMKQLIEMVDKSDIPAFAALTSRRKLQNVTMDLKYYCESVRSINRYKNYEKNYTSYKKDREISEYHELLHSTRVRKKLQVLNEDELKLYIIYLKTNIDIGRVEQDVKKKFKLYEQVCAGCMLCNVDNENIMTEIKQIRDEAKQIIEDIPTM